MEGQCKIDATVTMCTKLTHEEFREAVLGAELAPGLEVMAVLEMYKYQRCTLCSDTTQMNVGDGEKCLIMMASKMEDGRVVMESRS